VRCIHKLVTWIYSIVVLFYFKCSLIGGRLWTQLAALLTNHTEVSNLYRTQMTRGRTMKPHVLLHRTIRTGQSFEAELQEHIGVCELSVVYIVEPISDSLLFAMQTISC